MYSIPGSMNYLTFRVLDREYSIHDRFTWMTMGHFQHQPFEFNEYRDWMTHGTWDIYTNTIRMLYQSPNSLHTMLTKYRTMYQNRHPDMNNMVQWSILDILNMAVQYETEDTCDECTLDMTQSRRGMYLDKARHVYTRGHIREWFKNIHDCILENQFQTRKDKTELMRLVSKIYRIRLGISRFIRLWRWKRLPSNNITTTLDLEPIVLLSSKRILEVQEQNTIYTFDCVEVMKLWVQALLNHDHLFLEPKELKNPYTNLPFSVETLWNIYIHLQYHHFRIHPVVYYYVSCQMDIALFQQRYEGLLRNYAIDQHMHDLRVLIATPLTKLTPSEKYTLSEEYRELMNTLSHEPFHTDVFSLFYNHSLSTNNYKLIQKVLKDCFFILKWYFLSKYSHHPTQRQVARVEYEHEAIAYLARPSNVFQTWFHHLHEDECVYLSSI